MNADGRVRKAVGAASAAPPSGVPERPGGAPDARFEADATAVGDVARHLQHLEVERRLAARTLTLYRDALVRLATVAEADAVGVREAAPAHIRRWAAGLHRSGLAPASIALVLSAWRSHYRWLAHQGLVARNPVDGVRPPKAPNPLPKALSVDQAVAYTAPQTPAAGASPVLAARDQCLVELLYGCGLRVGEVESLDLRPGGPRAGWIDVADATAHVIGKGSKRRSVPVGGPALAALTAWLAVRPRLAGIDEPALFTTRSGTRLTQGQMRTRLAERAITSGLPLHVHPHMLRHSYASHLLQSSGDLRGVQELLGHSSIVSTQVYTRLDFGHLSKVYDAAHPRAKRRG